LTILRILAAVFALTIGLAFVAGSAAAFTLHCGHTAPEYAQAIRHFEGQAAKARALAAQNPLYESDVAYYASVLPDVRACQRNLAPVTTAAR